MKELIRSNDPVRLSFLTALLSDAGIESLLLDEHASVMQGSIDILQRRLMVTDDDLERARHLLIDAEQVDADHSWR